MSGKKETYYELTVDDSGELLIDRINIDTYLDELSKELENTKPSGFPIFLDDLPDDCKWNIKYEWPENGRIIIKGRIIVPKPEQVVVKYTVKDT